ncbi:MAG TPA: metallophosphoesterase [Thermodesulfovibrionales bacterium]|nr:metallophosphoesterase [Thermodesulfovibrionales bacterium]
MMLIGIISDTHDDMPAIGKAVDYFNSEGVSHVIHAGDLVSPFTFELFGELRCAFSAVFGNNDGDRLLLKQKSGGNIHHQPLILTFDEKKIVVVHEPDLVDPLLDSGHFNVIVFGHTHMPGIRNRRDVLAINPGKVARLHKGDSTLALLDTATIQAKIVHIV